MPRIVVRPKLRDLLFLQSVQMLPLCFQIDARFLLQLFSLLLACLQP